MEDALQNELETDLTVSDETQDSVQTLSTSDESALPLENSAENEPNMSIEDEQGVAEPVESEQNAGNGESDAPQKKSFGKKVKEWWSVHKPSTRRLIQIYAALLYNANIKGYITGSIFKGSTKSVCVPGMNCYSCPGAVGACPLGSLQNALSSSGKSASYYVFAILMLYGLIFGRMICGYLCPVGLGQDLLYNIKTPKLKKNKVTRVLSYLKYVILAVLVFGIPLVYALDQTAVPGFCKYICPAGTFGGAVLLLINPNNAGMYDQLGPLFTWKLVVLVATLCACVFVYRAFCRFLCPLGAIYGLFNRFALLGIKVNDDKCTNCGKCVSVCKMDIKKVGDHECINCGDCIAVCPTNAIVRRGGKVFLNNIDEKQVALAPAPLAFESAQNVVQDTNINATSAAVATPVEAFEPLETVTTLKKPNVKPKKVHSKKYWVSFAIKVTCIVLALALLVGAFVYYNVFADDGKIVATYVMEIGRNDGQGGMVDFSIGKSMKEIEFGDKGLGTKDSPFVTNGIEGIYGVPVQKNKFVYVQFSFKDAVSYQVSAPSYLSLKVYRIISGVEYVAYDFETDGATLSLDPAKVGHYGSEIGFKCYDFSLENVLSGETVTLSDFEGKVVVINFWGTWCGPCVTELPEFEQVRKEHEGVEVIAIHSEYKPADVDIPKFILNEKHWGDWGVKFVQGTDELYDLLGGTSSYPHTIIVDANGIIRFIRVGSLSKATLEREVENALAIKTE